MEKRKERSPGSKSRTELVWPGKYDEGGALADVQTEAGVLEIAELWDPSVLAGDDHAEAVAARPAARDGGATYGASPRAAPTRSLLVHGDNLRVMDALGEDLAEKIDLVYIDPPFATGSGFQHFSRIGEGDAASRKIRAQPSVRDRAYEDWWGQDPGAYLAMLAPRLRRIRSLLAPEGSLFVHLDRRAAHHVKLLLDEVFGRERCVNEIIWCYTGPSSPGMRSFANKHDIVFWYAKGDRWTFNVDAVRLPYKESTRRNEGRRTGFTTGDPSLVVRLHPLGKYPEDWWVLPVEAPASRVRTGYPTQKPERLLERVLLAASREGDLVADLFCGSGTTLAVAERLGRRWIGCDASRLAVETARRRLLDLPAVRPFEVRVLRSGIRTDARPVIRCGLPAAPPRPGSADDDLEPEERRILEAYCTTAEGSPAVVLLGEGKESALEPLEALERALASLPAGGLLHALRSRWEWRLLEAARGIARERGLRLVPVEVSIREGNGAPPTVARNPPLSTFREVPEVRAEVRFDDRGRAVVALTDLARLAPRLLPPEVSAQAREWSDLVDAWAVDWDWREGPLRARFAAYRTVKRRGLPLESPPRQLQSPPDALEGGAPSAILVQVRDILGVEAYLRLEVGAKEGGIRG